MTAHTGNLPKPHRPSPRSWLWPRLGLLATLSACCGGTDDTSSSSALPQLDGHAAVGAALAGAFVRITDATGAPACLQSVIVTSAAGAYGCTVADGRRAPFLVVVTDPSGGSEPLVSVATTAPQAGQTLVVNATPLTTAIVAQLAPGDSALAVVDNPALVDAARLRAITARVVEQLSAVRAAIGTPADYDPFTTPLVPGTGTTQGNTADRLLDVLRITTVNGVTSIATLDRPDAAVAVADDSATAPAPLPAPAAAVVTLADALRGLAPALEACFALPPAQRVTARNDAVPAAEGGAEATSLAAACQGIAEPGYRNNGYRWGQEQLRLLDDATMTGARFAAPVLLNFFPASGNADGLDRALLNLRYVDANGTAGAMIRLARRDPGTQGANARGSEWWLHGNQQPVDSTIQSWISRRENLASPGDTRFEAGFNIFINKDGPGSTGLRAARVKGPGLPTAGVVLTRPDASLNSAQSWLNLRNKTGDVDPATATPDIAGFGNLFRLQRTRGVAGAAASEVRPNPNEAGSDASLVTWAHPLDYGRAPGSSGYIDFAALKAMTTYSLELFYDQETAPRHVLTKTLLTPVMPATTALQHRWLDLGADTRRYLSATDARAAATPTLELGWQADPLAPTIGSAAVYSGGPGFVVNQGLVAVERGATSATATAPVFQGRQSEFAAITSGSGGYRLVQLRYRMLDGSFRDTYWQSN